MFFVAMLIHDGTQEFLINRFGKTAASGKWLGFLDCLGCFIGAYFVEPINFCCDASKEQDGNGNVLDLLSEAVGYTVYDYVLLENGEPCDCETNMKRKEALKTF